MKPERFLVESPKPPTVEVDWEALAAYIRFRVGKVAKTVECPCEHCFISVDLDKQGRVLGIESVGQTKIEIGAILKRANVEAPNVDFSRAQFVRPQHVKPKKEDCVAA